MNCKLNCPTAVKSKAAYGEILEAVDFAPCVYQGFFQQIESQIEDECANNHDRNKTDDDWSDN